MDVKVRLRRRESLAGSRRMSLKNVVVFTKALSGNGRGSAHSRVRVIMPVVRGWSTTISVIDIRIHAGIRLATPVAFEGSGKSVL